jgi:hypothetical protein
MGTGHYFNSHYFNSRFPIAIIQPTIFPTPSLTGANDHEAQSLRLRDRAITPKTDQTKMQQT